MADLTLEQKQALARARARAKANANRSEEPSSGEALGRGALQGVTVGLSDEVYGGHGFGAVGQIDAIVEAMRQGATIEEANKAGFDAKEARRAERLGEVRAANREAQEAHPGMYLTGEIVGSLPYLAVGGGAANTGRAVSTAGRGAALGGADAALYSYNTAEGGDRPEAAAKGAIVGSALGAATPFVAQAVRRGGEAAADFGVGLFDAATGRANNTRANRGLARILERSGKTADEIGSEVDSAIREGAPEFVLADALGNSTGHGPGQRALAGAARQPGPYREELVNALNRRQAGQGERVSAAISEALGGGETSAARTADLKAVRKAVSDPLYEAAREGARPVRLNDTLAEMDDFLGLDTNRGLDSIAGKVAAYRKKMAAKGEQLFDFETTLRLKQDIQDEAQTAWRAGKNNRGRVLDKLWRKLDSALEQASDGYRAANDTYALASRNIDAIPAGEAAAAGRVRPADALTSYDAMSAAQRPEFRKGYADALLRDVERAAPGANKVRPLTSDKRRAELAWMSSDPELLARRLGREDTMFATRAGAVNGSATAENLADMADTNGTDFLISAATGGGNMLMDALRWGGRKATGQNEATRELMAKALMSQDPQAILGPVLQQAQRDARVARLIDALMRTSGNRAIAGP